MIQAVSKTPFAFEDKKRCVFVVVEIED